MKHQLNWESIYLMTQEFKEKYTQATGKHLHNNYNVYVFPQMWSSTACGFPGMGGATMTEVYTVVISHYNRHSVYINGRHAYDVLKPTQAFYDDLKRFKLMGQHEFNKSPRKYDANT